jgi:hypothetical protein
MIIFCLRAENLIELTKKGLQGPSNKESNCFVKKEKFIKILSLVTIAYYFACYLLLSCPILFFQRS